jgi:hypothetical protein
LFDATVANHRDGKATKSAGKPEDLPLTQMPLTLRWTRLTAGSKRVKKLGATLQVAGLEGFFIADGQGRLCLKG